MFVKKLFILLCAAQILVGSETVKQVPVSNQPLSQVLCARTSYYERSYDVIKNLLMTFIPKCLRAQKQVPSEAKTSGLGCVAGHTSCCRAVQAPSSSTSQLPLGETFLGLQGQLSAREMLQLVSITEKLRHVEALKTPGVEQKAQGFFKKPSFEQMLHDACVAFVAAALSCAVTRACTRDSREEVVPVCTRDSREEVAPSSLFSAGVVVGGWADQPVASSDLQKRDVNVESLLRERDNLAVEVARLRELLLDNYRAQVKEDKRGVKEHLKAREVRSKHGKRRPLSSSMDLPSLVDQSRDEKIGDVVLERSPSESSIVVHDDRDEEHAASTSSYIQCVKNHDPKFLASVENKESSRKEG